MDVVRLNPQTWLPDDIVDGYTSMIWTERYTDSGDFVLTTPDVDRTRALIPEGSIISHHDTTEIMLVETSSVKPDDDGVPTLEVSGRSLETFLETRDQYTNDFRNPDPMVVDSGRYTLPEFISALIWNNTCNGFAPGGNQQDWFSGLVRSGRNNLPMTAVSLSLHGTNGSDVTGKPEQTIVTGPIYTPIKNLLAANNLGIRAIRPRPGNDPISTLNVISFNAAGVPSYSSVSADTFTKMRFEIYDGQIRTQYQGVREPVTFDYESGNIKDPSYLFSLVNHRNHILFYGGDPGSPTDFVFTEYQDPINDPLTTGLAYRPTTFIAAPQGDSVEDAAYMASLRNQADLLRKNTKKTVAFDGAVNGAFAGQVYGQDYGLGDLVILEAEYGVSQTMMVTEFIRNEDQDGDVGYPTLIQPPEKDPNEPV